MRFNCIERPLRMGFKKYGKIVARWPIPFVVIPVIVAVAFCGGFAFMTRETDVEHLFTPEKSPARNDQLQLKTEFKSISEYSAPRSLDLDVVAQVIITPLDKWSDLWNDDSLNEIFQLEDMILAISTKDGTVYDDVCLKEGASCVESGISLLRKTKDIQFPIHEIAIPGLNPIEVFMANILGNVTKNSTGYVEKVRAIKLTFYLEKSELGKEWSSAFVNELQLKQASFEYISLAMWTYYSIEEELAKNTDRIVPYFSITFTILISFSITACTLFDPVRTKPWLGFCGVISAGLAIGTSFGLLMYAGVPFVDIVAASPFLVLGIGVDDMFVMLAAWRKTNHYLKVEERMSEAFSEAAMSITITTITDVLAVGIGAITPFPSVRIFCTYTGVALALDFVFQITFFAGCMVLFGQREAAQRHAWTCIKVHAKSEHGSTGCYYMCCTGGISHKPEKQNDPKDDTEVMLMKFFRDTFSSFICHLVTKICVLVIWVVYIGFAIWGILILNQGLQLKRLAPDGSYVVDFYEQDEQYFREFGYGIQVVVHSVINSKNHVDEIDLLLKSFEQSPLFHDETFTVSWLRDYQQYAIEKSFDISYDFLFSGHFYNFISEPAYLKYKLDVLPNDDIFRFIVLSKDIHNSSVEIDVMRESRKIASNFPALNVTVFSPEFIFTEQYVAILPNTIQNLLIATGSMLIVALLLIPHPVVSIWVTFSVVSIIVGVIGYMSFWEVSLDTVAMINLIMCIGFCVDYSAHITYAYVSSKNFKKSDRVKDSLYTLGVPILQGSISTILAVVVLSASFAYIFRTFFKIMFLVILWGSLHGLFLLPVLLTLVGPKGTIESQVSVNSESHNHGNRRLDVEIKDRSDPPAKSENQKKRKQKQTDSKMKDQTYDPQNEPEPDYSSDE